MGSFYLIWLLECVLVYEFTLDEQTGPNLIRRVQSADVIKLQM